MTSFDYQLHIGKTPHRILQDYYASLRFASAQEALCYKEAKELVAFAPKEFFQELADGLKVKLSDILKLFKNWEVVKFFNKIGWSIKRLYDLLRRGYSAIHDISKIIKEFVEESGIVRFTSDKVKEFDTWLNEHPRIKTVSPFLLSAALLCIYLLMADSGDPRYDFDMSDILDALAGNLSWTDVFSGANGAKLLALFAAGVFTNISFPWPNVFSLGISVVYTLAKYFGTKLQRESAIDQVLKEARWIGRIRKTAEVFATQEAYDKYMKDHPKADPSMHSVKGKEDKKIEPEIKDKIDEKRQELGVKPKTKIEPEVKDKIDEKMKELKSVPEIKPEIKDKIDEKKQELESKPKYEGVTTKDLNDKVEKNLSDYDDKSVELKKETSKEVLSKDNIKKYKQSLSDNARLVAKKYRTILDDVTSKKIDEEISRFSGTIELGINDGSLKNVSAEKIDSLFQDQVKRLMHQEVETEGRALGDHGIRHVLGNVKATHGIMDAIEKKGKKKFTGAERLAASIAQMNHDVGYTVGEAAEKLDEKREKAGGGTKLHPKFSEELFNQESKRYEEILGKDLSGNVKNWIATHDKPDYDWEKDPVASAIRLADNTSLFGEDKVPALFYKSEKATKILTKIRLCMDSGIDYSKYKDELKKSVDEIDVPETMKQKLKNSVDELNDFGTNDILARMSGKLVGYEMNDNGEVEVNLEKSPEYSIIQNSFELGQKKFDNITKSDLGMRITPNGMTFANKDGKSVVKLNVKEAKEETKSKSLKQLQQDSISPDITEIRNSINPKNISSFKDHKIKDKMNDEEDKQYNKMIDDMSSEVKKVGLDKKEEKDWNEDDKENWKSIKAQFNVFRKKLGMTEKEKEYLKSSSKKFSSSNITIDEVKRELDRYKIPHKNIRFNRRLMNKMVLVDFDNYDDMRDAIEKLGKKYNADELDKDTATFFNKDFTVTDMLEVLKISSNISENIIMSILKI